MEQLNIFINYGMFDLFHWPKLFRIRYIINFFKGIMPIWIIFLMWFGQNFSLRAYVYLSLHGSYGIFWIIKDCIFPDKDFQKKQSIASSIVLVGLLCIYLLPSYHIAMHLSEQYLSNSRVCTSIFSYVFGLGMVLIADCQKYYILQTRQEIILNNSLESEKKKKFLITNGLFTYSRNTNYLGEILIYGSFAILAEDQMIWTLFSMIWLTLFLGRMIVKEGSLRQKDGCGFLLFQIAENNILNVLIWAVIFGFLVFDYSVGGAITLLKVI